uniref:DENN domain-containing protein 11 n=1 Tax=Salmo trutta TaxID=8032 RepID=A0A673XM74_SALTR
MYYNFFYIFPKYLPKYYSPGFTNGNTTVRTFPPRYHPTPPNTFSLHYIVVTFLSTNTGIPEFLPFPIHFYKYFNISLLYIQWGEKVFDPLLILYAAFLLLQTRRVELMSKSSILVSSDHNTFTSCPLSHSDVHWQTSDRHVYVFLTINRCISPTHPAGCMSQFIRFFGEQIMVLWKFALLRKRILLFSPPPVGVVCYRVYCCCCLSNVSIPGIGVSVPEFRPFFYVNVADIAALATEMSYVACTTEKIFEVKKELYDVYVDNQNVKTHRDSLQPLLRLNGADREKYRKLSEQRQMLRYTQEVDGDCTSNEEDLFILFFMEQNNRIFQTLSEVEASADHTLAAEHVRVYGIDVMLVIDNPCCP